MDDITWFKVDDKLHSHPKPQQAGMRAMGLWVMAGSWASAHLTDGFVPKNVLRMLGSRPQDARDLCDSGLWHVEEGGWRFHDWQQSNPTRDDVEEQRTEWANRQRLARERRKAENVTPKSQEGVTRDSRVTHGGVTLQGSQHPDPTRPDPTLIQEIGEVSDNLPALVATAQVPAKAGPPKADTRGSRLSADWRPSDSPGNLKAQTGRDLAWLSDQFERFQNYWMSKPGKDGNKTQWDLVWQNWIKKADDFAPRRQAATLGTTDWDSKMAQAKAQDAADEARRTA